MLKKPLKGIETRVSSALETDWMAAGRRIAAAKTQEEKEKIRQEYACSSNKVDKR